MTTMRVTESTATPSSGHGTTITTTLSSRSPTRRPFRNVHIAADEPELVADGQPDVPLCSIEASEQVQNERARAASSESQSPLPSLVLTPATTNTRTPEGSSPDAESIAAGLETMRLASPDDTFDMGGLTAAIAGAEVCDVGTPALAVERSITASPARRMRSGSRRRSSSQNRVLYDVLDEEAPPDRFHEPEFQGAFADAKGAMIRLAGVLSGGSVIHEPDSMMKGIHQRAEKLSQFQPPSTRTIGFVGDSGVGKSSLLNSLLDYEGLARSSNNGAACTCVATEYHYIPEDTFIIEVDRFSDGEIEEQLTDLLSSYTRYHGNQDNIDPDVLQACEEAAKVAGDVFQALFRGRLADHGVLMGSDSQDLAHEMIAEIHNRDERDAETRVVFHSAEECSNALFKLTSNLASTQGCQRFASWPLIKKIKVFLRAHILSKGLVLVDLPGLRDSNSARRNVTERYLLHCNEVLAVCNIGRATTDMGVEDVFKLAIDARLSKVGIVCTRSEDIVAGEAEKDWEGETGATVRRLNSAVARCRRACQDARDDVDAFPDFDLTEEDTQELLELHLAVEESRRLQKEAEYELKEYLIRTRNRNVTQSLRSTYRDKVPSGARLDIFCVSNADYWAHRKLPRRAAMGPLALSGIVALRKHCISIVGESQRRIAERYIHDEIPALLADLDLWVQSGAGTLDAERKEELRQALDLLEARLTRDFTGRSSLVNTIAKSGLDDFKDHIRANSRPAVWIRHSGAAAKEWNVWHHSTYSAFCANYGSHATGAVGPRDWNKEAMGALVADMDEPWATLRSGLDGDKYKVQAHIEDSMEWAADYLDSQPSSDIFATLAEAVGAKGRMLLAKMEAVYDEFDRDVSTLRTHAFSVIPTSIFRELMKETYQASQNEWGRNSDRRRKDIINNRLGAEDLFRDWGTQFRDRFRNMVEKLQADVQALVVDELHVIRATLNIVREENAATESERDPEFRQRVAEEVSWSMNELRRIRSIVE